jgi:hypothetical protein
MTTTRQISLLAALYGTDAASPALNVAGEASACGEAPLKTIPERFAECARLAAETTPEESLALQTAWLKERG